MTTAASNFLNSGGYSWRSDIWYQVLLWNDNSLFFHLITVSQIIYLALSMSVLGYKHNISYKQANTHNDSEQDII